MTALKLAACWILGTVLALWVLWRVARGRPAIVRGAVTSRAVHVAAFVLVLVGATGDRSVAQPRHPHPRDAGTQASATGFPVALRGEGVERYAELHSGRSAFAELGGVLARIDEPGWAGRPEPARTADLARVRELAAAIRVDVPEAAALVTQLESAVDRARRRRRSTLADLQGVLDAADQASAYEPWLGAWVWRRSGSVTMTGRERADLLARLERHLRVAEALTRAGAQSGGVRYVPWLKKSMAPRDYSPVQVPPGFVPAAEQLYPSIRLTSWEDEAAIELVVEAGSAGGQLWRGGARAPLAVGAALRLGRLDVAMSPSGPLVVRHAALGRITVPAGAALHAWGLPDLLDASQRARVQGWIDGARRGDRAAIRALETTLPACHALVRAELAAHPTAPGSARLRTLLALFDE